MVGEYGTYWEIDFREHGGREVTEKIPGKIMCINDKEDMIVDSRNNKDENKAS